MFTFLCLGLTAISQEEQPDSRNTTMSPAGIVVKVRLRMLLYRLHTVRIVHSHPPFTSMTKIPTAGPTKRCVRTNSTHNHASPKFLKMRILKPAGQLEHLLSSHLSAGEAPTFHSIPVPSAILRILHHALLHIPI